MNDISLTTKSTSIKVKLQENTHQFDFSRLALVSESLQTDGETQLILNLGLFGLPER